jgi:hypothetical protein
MQEAEEEDDDDIFVYTGGEQIVPEDVRRVRIDKSVKIIPAHSFRFRQEVIYVEFHDGIEIIKECAFFFCQLPSSVKLLGVKTVEATAFSWCSGLTDLEFGDKLETIGNDTFLHCKSITSVTIPSVRTIGEGAFRGCLNLTDMDLPEELESIEGGAFSDCPSLRRIAMPLRDDMIHYIAFDDCPNLKTITLVGGIHKTVESLHLESWRNEMKEEIDRINQVLPNTYAEEKTLKIQRWIRSVIEKIEHYNAEHHKLLKEATTLLELALWKANLDENLGGLLEQQGVRTTRGQRKRARKEICVTSGASIVVKNVLPFLVLT